MPQFQRTAWPYFSIISGVNARGLAYDTLLHIPLQVFAAKLQP